MSFFNQEQTEHMDSLAAIPDEYRCWCGWNILGKCMNCPEKSPSLAARIKVSCPHKQCRNYPNPNDPSGKIIHNVACPVSLEAEMEAISSDDWSKLLTLAEYGVWVKAFPKIRDMFDDNPGIEPLEESVRNIIDGLPRNLQTVGRLLAFPDNNMHCPISDKAIAEVFMRKVTPPKQLKP